MNSRRKIIANALLVIVPVVVCLFAAEVSLRILMNQQLKVVNDERISLYTYDDTLGWVPKPDYKGDFTLKNTIQVNHNSRGFRDKEHIITNNKKLMVLGDSFVWGFSVEAEDRFTDVLQTRLKNWSVYNLGVSGYGTDQEYLLLEKEIDYYQPDIVMVVYCSDNDRLDNSMNRRYRDYYKPYFKLNESNELVLSGTPVPKGSRYHFAGNAAVSHSYIVRLALKSWYRVKHPLVISETDPTFAIFKAMNALANETGSRFVVGLQKSYPLLEEFLKQESVDFVLLENTHIYSFEGGHWNPEGHRFVADRIEAYINQHQSF